MKQTSFLGKLVYGYDKLEEYLLCGSLVFTTLVIFAQVIMRMIGHSLTWSEELTRYIFVWQIWLGTSIAQRENQHIKVELLYTFVKSEKARAVVNIIATVILILFSAFLMINGAQLVQQMFVRGNVSSAMRLPMYIVYLVLPLSSALLCLRLLGRVVKDIKTLFSGNKEVG